MITQELDDLIIECGGLSSFARELQLCGHAKASHTMIRGWYISKKKHPQEKYKNSCLTIAKKFKVKLQIGNI